MSKTCCRCCKSWPASYYSKDARTKDGLRPECKSCSSKQARKGYLKRTYNLTEEDVDKLKKLQYNKCKICKDETELFIDHCHETGQIRGLLCNYCNVAIGFFKEDMHNFLAAGAYLVKFKRGIRHNDDL